MVAIPKRLAQRLETADRKLGEVRRHLIRCEPLDAHVVPQLRQIAEALQSAKAEGELMEDNEKAQRLLKEIQASTERARLLLESAAELNCRSALAQPSIAGSYMPDGEVHSLEFSGRMIVHA